MVNKSKIASVFIIALLLLCTVQPALAAGEVFSDDYHFTNIVPGTNILDLGKNYNGTFVNEITGTLTGYSEYRQEISINAESAVTNASIRFTIPKHEAMNSNYSDLRFLSSINSSELPYFINSQNTTEAEVFVRLNLTAGNNPIHLYFGNHSATPKSNSNDTFIYYFHNDTGQVFSGNNTYYTGSYSNIDVLLRPLGPATNYNAFMFFRGSGYNSSNLPMRIMLTLYNNSITVYASSSVSTPSSGLLSTNQYTLNNNTQINLSTNSNGTPKITRYSYVPSTGATIGNNTTVNGDNTSLTPFQRFASRSSGDDLRIVDVKIYNSTNTTVNLGQIIETPGEEQTNVNIAIPTTGVFSSVSFPSSSHGILNFSVNHTPSISFYEIDSLQYRGQINFSFVPVVQEAEYVWEISRDSSFSTTVFSGITTQQDLNSTGYVNINVANFTQLTAGSYWWRLKSAEEGNNTIFATSAVELADTISFRVRVIDGITGEWIQMPQSKIGNNSLAYQTEFIGNNVTFKGINYTNLYTFMFNESYESGQYGLNITATQGSEVQTHQHGELIDGVYYATEVIDDIIIGEPFTIHISNQYFVQNGTSAPWLNQTYSLKLDEYMLSDVLSDGVLNLSIERTFNNSSTPTGISGTVNDAWTVATHGIVHDSIGEPISTASFSVNNSATGASVGTWIVQPGGQYAYISANSTASLVDMFYRFSAIGYASVEGVIGGGIKQDVKLLASPTISIMVLDVSTNDPVNQFTTFLGDAQLLRSTDNGTVFYDNVTEGTYQVTVQADGYVQATRQINVSSSQTDFTLFITRSDNQTIWDEVNFVNFYILDQKGDYVYNTHVVITTLDGNLELYNQSVLGTAAFTVELNRSLNYVVHVTKPSEQVDEQINIFGSSLSPTMYLIVGKTAQPAPPNLQTGVQVSYNATTSQIVVTAKATDSRITNLYFQSINGTYIVSNTGQNGSLGNPTISSGNGIVTATWNVNGLEAGTVVTVDLVVKSNQAGEQELTARKTFLLKDGNGVFPDLFPDFGLSPGAREAVSIVILAVLALVSSSAGIPYASTLVPSMAYLVLAWAGWISWAPVYLVLIAIGILIVGYDMIKKTRM